MCQFESAAMFRNGCGGAGARSYYEIQCQIAFRNHFISEMFTIKYEVCDAEWHVWVDETVSLCHFLCVSNAAMVMASFKID